MAAKKKKAPAAPDHEKVAELTDLIGRTIDGPRPEDLVHRLEKEEGLALAVSKGQLKTAMAGITAHTPTDAAAKGDLTLAQVKHGLRNWCAAGRRARLGRA